MKKTTTVLKILSPSWQNRGHFASPVVCSLALDIASPNVFEVVLGFWEKLSVGEAHFPGAEIIQTGDCACRAVWAHHATVC